MEPKHLYTIRWTQPYATEYQRPYLRQLQQELETIIELLLELGDFEEANQLIEKVKYGLR